MAQLVRSRARHGLLAATILATFTALTACSGGAAPAGDKAGRTLTIAVSAAPTLDPYKANVDPNNIQTASLGYASLIRLNADRTYSGDLAESYGYTDTENKIFQMRLRPGLKFADGTPLDAAAVVASLQYMLKVSPNAKSWAGTITGITASDASTIVVTNKSPNPVMRQLFSQAVLSGSVVSPAGLADQATLAERTFGAGPYVLDPAGTVPNDHYTYTINPNYWNKNGQHWQKVVVRVIPDANATVQAIQANQIDYASLNADAGPAVKAAGLKHVTSSVAMIGMMLADRDGTVAPQLKDVRVRQALSYAIDREAIATALFGEFAKPTSQTAAPGFDGYDKALDARYPHDPERAKRLLAEAGYAGGFTLRIASTGAFGIGLVTQAVAAQWKEIGVTVELNTDAQMAQWQQSVLSRKFPVSGYAFGNLPTYLLSLNFALPVANPFNPFATQDEALTGLLTQASNEADQAAQAGLYRQANARLTELAWFAPVVRIEGIAVMGPRVAGVEQTSDNGLPNVATVRPAAA
ncbi:ABC transporter substrate-binding protein [Dactylosporangium sp. NPDC000555]|uniref:ABC transporter substrate-binding protein n=1 Tax=Dactylosporangium sp. NPDC000555 TaxID=3154260 RepID=UPI0033208DB7